MRDGIFLFFIEAITPVLVALVASGGFWTYLEKKKEESHKSRSETLTKAFQDISNISERVDKTGRAVDELESKVASLQESQTMCATKLDKIKELENKFGNLEVLIDELKDGSALSVAYARDRLNFLSNKYMNQGYIPKEDIIPFKLLGETYIKCKQNTEVKLKFQHCIEKLPIVDKANKIDEEE